MTYNSDDYRQMADVIDYIHKHVVEQPSLDTLAGVAGLSPHHFHHKFTAWVGVTPKSFLQYLTYDNAKDMLGKGKSVLDVTYDVGLSSPSRLHDLCITLEAVTPGEIKAAGAGLSIEYGFGFTPFGKCLIANSSRGIVYFVFVDPDQQAQSIIDLKSEWPNATFRHNDQLAYDLIRQLFNHDNNHAIALRAFVKGTKFQIRVWNALLNIVPGELLSYGQLADSIDQPSASRAVGSAVGKNPLAYLIPCHRVIRATGHFGEYRWGAGRKRLMIAYEMARK